MSSLDLKRVGLIALGVVLLFKLINVNIADFTFVPAVVFFGTAVLVSLALGLVGITSAKNKEGYFLNVILGAVVALVFLKYVSLGITNVQSMVQLPVQAQSILSFVVEDIVGIPLWFIGVLAIGSLIVLMINPLLGLGLLMLATAVVLTFVTPGVPDEFVAGAGGLVTILFSLIRAFTGGQRSPMGSGRPIPLDFKVNIVG